MSATVQKMAQVFRPQGSKPVALGNAWAKGGQINLVGQVDLSVPIVKLRFIVKGRIAITTAAYTSVKPEQLLNLIQELKITGNNTRQNGNCSLFDMDSSSWMGFKGLFSRRPYHYYVSKAAGALTLAPSPTTPFTGGGFDGTVNNFDFIIGFDVEFYPLKSGDGFVPGWALRSSEWKDSLQIQITFAKLADNAENEIGVSAATSVTTLTAFQSGAGSPTVDVYSVPTIMGLDLAGTVLPGVLSRVSQPVTATVQTTGANVPVIANLQKQLTGRVLFKTGVSTSAPNFSSLSDGVMTAVGITVGANRAVRNLVDTFAHKHDWTQEYNTDPIQGYMGFDFLGSDNPFSAYPGDQVGTGATFQLVANITGAANQMALIVQEQHLFQPAGPLYNS